MKNSKFFYRCCLYQKSTSDQRREYFYWNYSFISIYAWIEYFQMIWVYADDNSRYYASFQCPIN